MKEFPSYGCFFRLYFYFILFQITSLHGIPLQNREYLHLHNPEWNPSELQSPFQIFRV